MTLETKKTLALAFGALAIMVTIAGIALMSTQIKTQGSGFFVGYLLYALAILAGGLFIAWLPNMKNQKWGFKLVDGKIKWQKDTRVTDPNRTRLVWWPLITLFFEFFGLFDYCFQLWERTAYEVLKYIFIALTLLALAIWCVIIIVEDVRETKKNNGQL